MLRILLYALTILHLGPGLAFAVLAFGCEGDAPWLGSACGQSEIQSFVYLTLGLWLVMGLLAFLKLRTARSR
jgi:hypothetical protein